MDKGKALNFYDIVFDLSQVICTLFEKNEKREISFFHLADVPLNQVAMLISNWG